MKKFGENLKEIRLELGLTQKEFGNRVGFDARTICNWEKSRNTPTIYVVKKISKEFNISLDDLFDFDEE